MHKGAPNTGVFGNDAKAAARSIEQHTVECNTQRWRLPPIDTGDNRIAHAHALKIGSKRLDSLFVGIVRHEKAVVLHYGTDVSAFATGSCCHIQNTFTWLRCKSHDGQEGGRTLQHVVACHVFGRCPDRHLAVEHHDAHLHKLVKLQKQ